jgi:glucose-1-phosphate cytidylyltransferase
MKVVILAGGLGTRLSEETEVRPKPMVEIGGRPMLWHILKVYAHHGFSEFCIALGYKGEFIKHYFLDYRALSSNLTVSIRGGQTWVDDSTPQDDWKVHLVDTGVETNTGGRVKRLAPLLKDGTFMLTYGDGVANVDVKKVLAFHRSHGKLATITAVRPPSRFGGLVFEGDRIKEFQEKPQIGEGWINGGFMVLEPGVLDFLQGDATSLEADGLDALARQGQLMAYRHDDFWQCMDTLREVRVLQRLWAEGQAPWKVWP